jgi:hypothetical protein
MAEETSSTAASWPESGYVNGSDMLLAINDDCIGHCTEHTVTYDTESKTRSVKAPATTGVNASSLFDETVITKLSITISFKGLRNYDESEKTFSSLLSLWKSGGTANVECFARTTSGAKPNPYLKASVVVTKLTENNPAGDDASYDGELKVTGAPETFDPDYAVS